MFFASPTGISFVCDIHTELVVLFPTYTTELSTHGTSSRILGNTSTPLYLTPSTSRIGRYVPSK